MQQILLNTEKWDHSIQRIDRLEEMVNQNTQTLARIQEDVRALRRGTPPSQDESSHHRQERAERHSGSPMQTYIRRQQKHHDRS